MRIGEGEGRGWGMVEIPNNFRTEDLCITCSKLLTLLVQTPLESLLHSAGHCLAKLSSLDLYNMELQHFPDALAENLGQLTALNLARNSFTRVPAAVTKIATLRKLVLCQNYQLQLNSVDVNTLALLPDLEDMVVWLPGEEEKALWEGLVGNRLPNLNVL
jgi:hypothetical protein